MASARKVLRRALSGPVDLLVAARALTRVTRGIVRDAVMFLDTTLQHAIFKVGGSLLEDRSHGWFTGL
jgi:hypothetical protein